MKEGEGMRGGKKKGNVEGGFGGWGVTWGVLGEKKARSKVWSLVVAYGLAPS
jgi:hypothetical protein